ncbi:hypothetical protein PInf_022288 [Phytophthora infestans]|nr:hypothetical protein PInf_022288 [Phytophthora infestans]
MVNRELSMCEKAKARKYTRSNRVSVKTLKKNMFGLESVVQGRIKLRLRGKKIGFAIDAWTEDGTNFVAVIGVTEDDKYLLCFLTLMDESDMGSDAISSCLTTSLMREDNDILDKVHALMGKLNTIKNRHHLREAPYEDLKNLESVNKKLQTTTVSESSHIKQGHVATGPQEEGEDAHQFFAEAALSQEEVTSSGEDPKWTPPTSNDVERLFSRAGIVF